LKCRDANQDILRHIPEVVIFMAKTAGTSNLAMAASEFGVVFEIPTEQHHSLNLTTVFTNPVTT
jgi:hypothetical protein